MKDVSKLIAEGNTEESQENTDDVTCPGHQKNATVNDHVFLELYNKIKSSISSILSLDDKFEFKQSVDNFVGVVLKDDFEKQSERAKSIQENDSGTFTPLNLPDDDLRSKLPLLARLHLPLTPYFISALLNEIIKISEIYPQANLLTMKRFDGSTTTLVPIPNSKNVDSFTRNVLRKKWVDKIPESIFPNDKSVAVEWLLYELGKKYEDEFVVTSKKLGYPLVTKQMNEIAAAAMWQESNVSTRSQRIILRHMKNEFGTRLVVPEYKISKLGQNFVEPNCASFIMQRKQIHYWTKSIPDILVTCLKRKLDLLAIDSSESIDSFESVDLVIGGDHGQGKFRSVMKVILRNRYGKNVNHFCIKVNHIDCEKDTYEVLKKSIAAPLNADIKSINESKHIQVLTDIITKAVCLFIGTEDQVDMSQYIIKKSVPVRIIMCGDLAFFATVLVKVNMSGKW